MKPAYPYGDEQEDGGENGSTQNTPLLVKKIPKFT